MNVICENVDALNGFLKIQVSPEDYKEKVEKTLSDYRKRANVPGFRPGKAPMSLINKQYGKSVLAEELNRLVNDGIQKYIDENKLQILGSPIPKTDEESVGNWDSPSEFNFTYELGYAPTFEINLSASDTFEYYKVKIDDKILDEEVDNLRKRYGKLVTTNKIEGKEIVSVELIELNENEEILEGGLVKKTSFSAEIVTDKKTLTALKKAKAGDLLNLDIKNLTKNDKDLAAMLGIEEAYVEGRPTLFQVEILEIRKMEMAELNEEFFEKIAEDGSVTSESDLKEKIKNDLAGIFRRNEEVVFMNKVYDHLMESIQVEFPEAFLRKWLKMSSEKGLTDNQLDTEMENYLKSLKYRLIQNKMFVSNNVEITFDDIMNHTKGLLLENYSRYGIPTDSIPEEELQQSAMRILQDESQRSEIQSQVTEAKFQEIILNVVSKAEREVSYEEFQELAK